MGKLLKRLKNKIKDLFNINTVEEVEEEPSLTELVKKEPDEKKMYQNFMDISFEDEEIIYESIKPEKPFIPKDKNYIPTVSVYYGNDTGIDKRCRICGGKIVKSSMGNVQCENSPKCYGTGRYRRICK